MAEEMSRPGRLGHLANITFLISPIPHPAAAPSSKIVNPNFNNRFSPHSLAPLCSAASASQALALCSSLLSHQKYLPLDLRPKKTRAIRRRLTKHQVLF